MHDTAATPSGPSAHVGVQPAGPRLGEDGRRELVRAVHAVERSTGVPLAFAGVPDGQGLRLVAFTRPGGALENLHVSEGRGVGGRVLAEKRPQRVVDYSRAPTITHEYDQAVASVGIRAVLAVPVIVSRHVRAVLYGAVYQPMPVGDRAITATVATARTLARQFRVVDEVRQRLRAITAGIGPTNDAQVRLEELREVHAELELLRDQVDDPDTRDRLENAIDRMAYALHDVSGQAAGSLTRDRRTSLTEPLAPREVDVLTHVARGGTNAQVAMFLGLQPETVKSYLRSAYRKLGANSRIQAVNSARSAGYLL